MEGKDLGRGGRGMGDVEFRHILLSNLTTDKINITVSCVRLYVYIACDSRLQLRPMLSPRPLL